MLARTQSTVGKETQNCRPIHEPCLVPHVFFFVAREFEQHFFYSRRKFCHSLQCGYGILFGLLKRNQSTQIQKIAQTERFREFLNHLWHSQMAYLSLGLRMRVCAAAVLSK